MVTEDLNNLLSNRNTNNDERSVASTFINKKVRTTTECLPRWYLIVHSENILTWIHWIINTVQVIRRIHLVAS